MAGDVPVQSFQGRGRHASMVSVELFGMLQRPTLR